MHDIFISHSSADKEAAQAILATLEGAGISCWIANRDIVPGSPWAASIINAINRSKVVLLILSDNSNKPGPVVNEVERAMHRGIKILPVHLSDLIPCQDLEFFISTSHRFDAFPGKLDQYLPRLLTTVSALLQEVAPHSQHVSENRNLTFNAQVDIKPEDSEGSASGLPSNGRNPPSTENRKPKKVNWSGQNAGLIAAMAFATLFAIFAYILTRIPDARLGASGQALQEFVVPSSYFIQALVIFAFAERVSRLVKRREVDPRIKISAERVTTLLSRWQAAWIAWCALYLALGFSSVTATVWYQRSHGPFQFNEDLIADPNAVMSLIDSYRPDRVSDLLGTEENGKADPAKDIKSIVKKLYRPIDAAKRNLYGLKGDASQAPLTEIDVTEKKLFDLTRKLSSGAITEGEFLRKKKQEVAQLLNLGLGAGYGPNYVSIGQQWKVDTIAAINKYSPGALQLRSEWYLEVLSNVLNNTTTLFIVLCFLAMSIPTLRITNITLFYIIFAFCIQFPVCWASFEGILNQWSVSEFLSTYQWASGFLAAVGIALLTGRLESRWIGIPLTSIVVLYGYAAIQPAYGAFEGSFLLQLLVPLYALFGKLTLLSIFDQSIENRAFLYYFARIGARHATALNDRLEWMKLMNGGRDIFPSEVKEPLEAIQFLQSSEKTMISIRSRLDRNMILDLDLHLLASDPAHVRFEELKKQIATSLNQIMDSGDLLTEQSIVQRLSTLGSLETITNANISVRARNRWVLFELFGWRLASDPLESGPNE